MIPFVKWVIYFTYYLNSQHLYVAFLGDLVAFSENFHLGPKSDLWPQFDPWSQKTNISFCHGNELLTYISPYDSQFFCFDKYYLRSANLSFVYPIFYVKVVMIWWQPTIYRYISMYRPLKRTKYLKKQPRITWINEIQVFKCILQENGTNFVKNFSRQFFRLNYWPKLPKTPLVTMETSKKLYLIFREKFDVKKKDKFDVKSVMRHPL